MWGVGADLSLGFMVLEFGRTAGVDPGERERALRLRSVFLSSHGEESEDPDTALAASTNPKGPCSYEVYTCALP